MRASWRMTHTSPDLTHEPIIKNWKPGDPVLPDPKAPTLEDAPPYPEIWITNTVPYSQYYVDEMGVRDAGDMRIVDLALQGI